MRRKEFLKKLEQELKFYKKIDTQEIIYYYEEMIQDAIDEGQNEEDFIASLGPVHSIIRNMVGDEEFIHEVKRSNNNSLTTLIGGTVKIFAFFFYGVAIFTTFIVALSIIISGIAIVFQSGIYIYANSLILSDYILIGGLILLGIGITLVGISIIKSTLRMSKSIKLYIIRKTKQLFRKKEVNNYE
ncbi:MAG: DUF1700 domain-containing protein [Tenericutes bacterium]|jgi:uncharacterized membrane protein|nr:DUF1700 domain-containing protein [Mycoplasmatota bacterium]